MLVEAIPQNLVGSSRFRVSYNVVQINRQVYSILDTDFIVDAEVRNRNPVSQGTITSRATMVTTPSVILGPRVNYVYAYSTLNTSFNCTLKECHTQLVYQIRRMSTIYPEGHDIRFEISDGFVYNSNIACFSKPQVVYRFRVPYYGEMTVDSPLDMEFLYTRIRNPQLIMNQSQFEPIFCRATKNATFVSIHFPWSEFIGFRPKVDKKYTGTLSSAYDILPRGTILRLMKSNQQAQANFEMISTTYPNLYWKGTKRGFKSTLAAAFTTNIKLPYKVPAFGTWTTLASNVYNNTRRRSFQSTIDRAQTSVSQTPTRVRFSKSTQSSVTTSVWDFSNVKYGRKGESTMSSSSSIAAKLSSRPYLDYDTYQGVIPNVTTTYTTYVNDSLGIASVMTSDVNPYSSQVPTTKYHMFDPNTLSFVRELTMPSGYWGGPIYFSVPITRTFGYNAGISSNYIAFRASYQNSSTPQIVIWDRSNYSTRTMSVSLTNQVLHSLYVGDQGLAILKASSQGLSPFVLEIYRLSDLSLYSTTTLTWSFDVLTEVIQTNHRGHLYIPGRFFVTGASLSEIDPDTGYGKGFNQVLYNLNNLTIRKNVVNGSHAYAATLGPTDLYAWDYSSGFLKFKKYNISGAAVEIPTPVDITTFGSVGNDRIIGITNNYVFTRSTAPNLKIISVWNKNNNYNIEQRIQDSQNIETSLFPVIQGDDEYISQIGQGYRSQMYKNDGN